MTSISLIPTPSLLPIPRPAPLTGVHFRLSPDKRRAVLHVPVPDKQPSGTYSGPIVDAATGKPGGTLVVQLLT